MAQQEQNQVQPESKVIKESNTDTPKQALAKVKVRQRKAIDKKKKGRSRKGRDDGFDIRLISIRRVTRVHKGGKRMRLSVVAVVGDRKGKVGIGIGKGSDVKTAEDKAVSYAKKHLVYIDKKGDTIPHEIQYKSGAAKVFLKPAAPGTGIIAGASVRAIVELAGIKDILTKIIGSKNSINNAYATLEALTTLRNTRL